ncbi:MAG: hypothetical protein EP335_11890 [Alphaproteobacteria bacterium]|nr:MAG: hypothetical protein EP335_11890 [Alphaproteobacteria bacterium]
MTNCPYQENSYLRQSKTNLCIKELRNLSAEEFREWAREFRKEVVYAWDVLGIPVIDGRNEDDIVQDFSDLYHYNIGSMERLDELTGQKDCIANVSTLGACCNQFFPTLLKTEDISSTRKSGKSIYGYFAYDDYFESFVKLVHNLFRSDPFSYFSKAHALSSIDLEQRLREGAFKCDVWFVAKKEHQSRATVFTHDQVQKMVSNAIIEAEQVVGDGDTYEFREYFGAGLCVMDVARMFRVAFDIRPASNFPPAIAKYLYMKFTEGLESQDKIVVFDPSAGWGGRILSAMSTAMERTIHYVGTDPNSDHWMPDEKLTKYEYLAAYFNREVAGKRKNTYELFALGSEDIHLAEDFQKYKGQVDFVFTSPPYFAAEGYSNDDTQSHIKFSTYEAWRDKFLRRTLETCVEWLKPGRWLCWNVADVTFGSNVLPLQEDCLAIMEDLGMEYKGFKKMVLAKAPGGDREKASGVPTMKNFCKVNGEIRKFEPIYMFWKPYPADHLHAVIPTLAELTSSR